MVWIGNHLKISVITFPFCCIITSSYSTGSVSGGNYSCQIFQTYRDWTYIEGDVASSDTLFGNNLPKEKLHSCLKRFFQSDFRIRWLGSIAAEYRMKRFVKLELHHGVNILLNGAEKNLNNELVQKYVVFVSIGGVECRTSHDIRACMCSVGYRKHVFPLS